VLQNDYFLMIITGTNILIIHYLSVMLPTHK